MTKATRESMVYNEKDRVIVRSGNDVPAKLKKRYGKKILIVKGTVESRLNGSGTYQQQISVAFASNPEKIVGYHPSHMFARA